jgi:hypothetical protein
VLKYLLPLLLALPAFAGGPAIFNGPRVKTLKQNLSLNGAAYILSGTVNPSSVATSAPAGSLYLNTSTGAVYKKTDAGSSTNWSELTPAATYAWSGYHADNCTWTSTAVNVYTTYGTDATCTFTERLNSNFGTVSSHSSSGNKLPGITFTVPVTGVYKICAIYSTYHGSSTRWLTHQLHDGTSGLGTSNMYLLTASRMVNATLCGHYSGTAAATATINMQGYSDAAGTHEVGSQGTAAPSIEWSIHKL